MEKPQFSSRSLYKYHHGFKPGLHFTSPNNRFHIPRFKSMIRVPDTARQLLVLLLICMLPSRGMAQGAVTDPWEKFNRPVYQFNQVLDAWVIRPVSSTYDHYMPRPVKRGVSNFFNNIDDINVVVNDVLQWKLQHAMNDSSRLVLNTTLGLGGFIDVAAAMGLYKNYEDFGQTLAVWGLGDGGYLMLPLFGASTVRDTVGMVPDMIFNPISWIPEQDTRTVFYAMDIVDTRTTYLAAESMIRGDRYQFVRNAWIQRRAWLVADGQVRDELDDF
jgi:phospholipid-binding lipoprotein MlaA